MNFIKRFIKEQQELGRVLINLFTALETARLFVVPELAYAPVQLKFLPTSAGGVVKWSPQPRVGISFTSGKRT